MSSNRAAVVLLVLLVGLAVVLFVRSEERPAPVAAGGSAAPVALPPLGGESEIVALAGVIGDGARASLPTGATEPRPIVIVLHADGERADQQCRIWRGITKAAPFVLCPQLAPAQPSAAVEAQLRSALRELKQRFDAHVAKGPVVLVGFGSGAEHAVQVARQEPSFFARLVLIDAGHAAWGATSAAAFKQRGGRRLLFACSNDTCRSAVEPKVAVIRTLELPVALLYAGELPGALDPRMVALLSERYAWLTSDDPPPRRVPNPREKRRE